MKEELVSKKLLIYIGVCLALLVFDGVGVLQPFKLVAERLLAPMEAVGFKIVELSNTPYNFIKFAKNGTAQVADLQSRLSEQIVSREQLTHFEQENAALRKLLGTPLPPEWKFLPVKVLGVSQDTILVAAGEAHGLKKGMSVIYNQQFVGTLDEVSIATSTVLRVISHEAKVAVLESSKNTSGVVRGTNDGVILDQVLQGVDVVLGKPVVTSGEDGLLPGLIVGTIEEKISLESDVYQQFQIRPAFDGSSSQLFVVIGVGNINL